MVTNSVVPWGKKGWQKGKGKGNGWYPSEYQPYYGEEYPSLGSGHRRNRSESSRSRSQSRDKHKSKSRDSDPVAKARETLLANDPEYKNFLLAKSMAEEDEKIRKQATMFANAIKPALEKMASSVSVGSPVPSPRKPSPTPSVRSSSPPPSHSKRTLRDNDSISKSQAAWIEAIFNYVVQIPKNSSWDDVVSKLATKLEKTKDNRKNLECVKSLDKFLDRQSPRPKTPKTGRSKAELLVSIIRS